MNIILTDYGVSILNDTQAPIQIKKFALGTGYAYNPSSSQTGLKGTSVYSNTLEGPNIINANVYQYSVFLDYNIGDFYFGEIAYYDETDQCVAIAVSESVIEKRVMKNSTSGNSLRLDAYLSMVGTTYNTWADAIGSDITFQVPIIESIDNLPPVQATDPNLYICNPANSNASATMVYTAGNTGLWHFDCYTFQNCRAFSVKSATATSITLDLSDLDTEARQDMIPLFVGDKIVEFSSGECYSICRNVKTFNLRGNTATVGFATALAIVPKPGDTLLYFSRSQVSTNTLQIPIASDARVGGIVVSDPNFTADTDGTLHLSFTPVKTVNGVGPDEEGNVVIDTYTTSELPDTDLNNCTTMGVYAYEGEVQNAPDILSGVFTLEVIEQIEGHVIQRVSDSTHVWWRTYDGSSWTAWNTLLSSNNPIDQGTF